MQFEGYSRRFFIFLLVMIAILCGGYLRVSYTFIGDFPLNDGGLFWTMTQELVQNEYALPRFTSYNQAGIPYAYPPGAFYLLGFLNQQFHLSLVDLFRFEPLVFSIAAMLLIFPIARLVLHSDLQAVLATFAFALIRPAYTWLLMGGGVTRSPALFFSLLAIFCTLKFYKRQDMSVWLYGAVLSVTTVTYFHIEMAWVTALTMAFLALIQERSRKTAWFLAANAVGGAVLLAPYWLTIASNHGIDLFLKTMSSGYRDFFVSVAMLFIPLYTEEKYFQLLGVLGFLGIFASIATRQFTPVLWLILISLVNPRSVYRSSAIPEALLIAVSLDVFIVQGLENILHKKLEPPFGISKIKNRLVHFPYWAAAVLLFHALLLSISQQMVQPQVMALSKDEQAAISWAAGQTEPEATFLIFPTGPSWEYDYVSEWFPALSRRRSMITVQGYEWTSAYAEKIAVYEEFEDCIRSEETCFQDWRQNHAVTYDYVLIPLRSQYYQSAQVRAMGLLDGCTAVFANPETEIYDCKQDS